jgi:hypothetical protein
MTPLDKPLKRALIIGGRDYVITLNPEALKITEKGHRLGLELKWAEIVSGESALAVALHASLGKFEGAATAPAGKAKELPKRTARAKGATGARRGAKKRVVPKKRS